LQIEEEQAYVGCAVFLLPERRLINCCSGKEERWAAVAPSSFEVAWKKARGIGAPEK